jgi:hypothetical protein
MTGTKPLLSVAALSAGTIFSGGVRAEDFQATGNFGWLGVGKVFQLEKGHIFWVGEFSGNFANDAGKGSPYDGTGWKCPGSNDIDLNNKINKAAGFCIISDQSGDLAYSSWQCQGPADGETCNGTNKFTGGTGKYQGISGSSTFVGHTKVHWPDGTTSGYSTINR